MSLSGRQITASCSLDFAGTIIRVRAAREAQAEMDLTECSRQLEELVCAFEAALATIDNPKTLSLIRKEVTTDREFLRYLRHALAMTDRPSEEEFIRLIDGHIYAYILFYYLPVLLAMIQVELDIPMA